MIEEKDRSSFEDIYRHVKTPQNIRLSKAREGPSHAQTSAYSEHSRNERYLLRAHDNRHTPHRAKRWLRK